MWRRGWQAISGLYGFKRWIRIKSIWLDNMPEIENCDGFIRASELKKANRECHINSCDYCYNPKCIIKIAQKIVGREAKQKRIALIKDSFPVIYVCWDKKKITYKLI
jgi:hypothetical protein